MERETVDNLTLLKVVKKIVHDINVDEDVSTDLFDIMDIYAFNRTISDLLDTIIKCKSLSVEEEKMFYELKWFWMEPISPKLKKMQDKSELK